MSNRLDHYVYWSDPPPVPSPKLGRWIARIKAGWRPNSRIQRMGRDACSEFYDVYQWEYLHVLLPLIDPALAQIAEQRAYEWSGSTWTISSGLGSAQSEATGDTANGPPPERVVTEPAPSSPESPA